MTAAAIQTAMPAISLLFTNTGSQLRIDRHPALIYPALSGLLHFFVISAITSSGQVVYSQKI
jgi:hypothetical protein